jgi:FkbM family methyltransferase
MNVTKNQRTFNVKGQYSETWFSNGRLDSWEQDTFHILEHYANKSPGNVYIDIGAWIGPTVLYAASIYTKVIALEPDPVAISRLEKNLEANTFDNVVLVKKGLSDTDGTTRFGGNGELGNSESTILVSDKNYSTWGGEHGGRWTKTDREANVIEIDTLTIETLLREQHINPSQISLIKMDVEGGELIIVPQLKAFLQTYKPAFYVSLHYCFLKPEHISSIVTILFSIYDNCYTFDGNGTKTKRTINDVLKNSLTSIVFE